MRTDKQIKLTTKLTRKFTTRVRMRDRYRSRSIVADRFPQEGRGERGKIEKLRKRLATRFEMKFTKKFDGD